MRRFARFSKYNFKRRTGFALLSLLVSGMLLSSSTPNSTSTSVLRRSIAARQQRTKTNNNKCTRCSPPGDQLIYIPVIDLPEARGGEIVFNSRSPEAMDVTPVFYKRNGETVIADPVRIDSAEIRYVNIEDLLPARYRHEKNWGGFALSYYGANRQMWSQFRFLGVNGGANVDEFFTVKDESRSAVFEAAWWMPQESEAIVALGNISDAPTTATVNFGNHHARTVHLQPHATELVREQHRKEGTESVKIDVTGAAGSIVPTGIITTEDGSFNSVIRFYDPTKAKQPNLYANGFRVFGTTPHMVLKNTTQSSIAVLPKISPLTGSAGITLSQVSLNPNETKEVDLSDLLRAAKTRSDLHVVSVEVTNWVAPGSVIGSLYATNKRTGTNYDVPLRDSGPIRSMTGAYPWKIDGDYKSIAYVTNITDEPVGFAVELAYDGGKFTLGPQKLQPRETATFDLGRIRDERMKDIAGHTLPGNVTHGQFKWAIRGVSNGKIVLIGRTEMVSRSQDISSSYSCPMDCGPTYEPNGTFPTDLFNGQSGQASVTETASWNYGYTIGPYPASASWSADDPAIVTFDPSSASTTTLTPEDAGSTLVTGLVGWQDRYDWDGLECFYEGSFPEVVESILDMLLAVEFVDAHIENTDNTAAFIPLYNTANLEPHEYSVPGACSGDNFILKVRFRVPSESANCCSNDATSFVVLPSNNKFHFVNVIADPNPLNPPLSKVFYGNDNPAFVRIGLKKNLDGSGTNNSVRISVGGEYGSGEPYRGNGTVHLVCP